MLDLRKPNTLESHMLCRRDSLYVFFSVLISMILVLIIKTLDLWERTRQMANPQGGEELFAAPHGRKTG